MKSRFLLFGEKHCLFEFVYLPCCVEWQAYYYYYISGAGAEPYTVLINNDYPMFAYHPLFVHCQFTITHALRSEQVFLL